MAINLTYKDTRKTAKPLPGNATAKSLSIGSIISNFGKAVRPAELIFFTSHLSLMLEINTPLDKALKAIESQTSNIAFRTIIQTMIRDIEEGNQLSDALKKHPRVFNKMFVSMVKAGESGGFLTDILGRIVEMQEKRQALVTQLRSALTYPAFLCVLGVSVLIFVMVSVLPKFTAFFAGKESILPATTRLLMKGSDSLKGYWWLYIISVIGLSISFKIFKESRPGKALIDKLIISTPIISKLSTKIYTTEMLRLLGNLITSNVPLLDALEVTRGSISNQYFRDFIDRIIKHVEQGGKFSQPFATCPFIMDSVKQMVATGEEAGKLSKAMLRLTTFYEVEVDQDLKKFSTLLEPAALIVMGGVVGLIVSSIILPMFKLAHVVG